MTNTDILYFAEEIVKIFDDVTTMINEDKNLDAEEIMRIKIAAQHLLSAEALFRVTAG